MDKVAPENKNKNRHIKFSNTFPYYLHNFPGCIPARNTSVGNSAMPCFIKLKRKVANC